MNEEVMCPRCYESDLLEYEGHEIQDNNGIEWFEYDVYYCNACKCTFDLLTDSGSYEN